jgi:hypothetical protein
LVEYGYQNGTQWGLLPGNWGTDKDFAPTWPWLRPQALAIELYNSAVQGDYHRCTGAPAGITCAAFYANGAYNLAVSNANSSATPLTVTLPSGATPPCLGRTVLYKHGIADNNENSSSVYIGPLPGIISCGTRQISFSAPPFSAVAVLTGGAFVR